MLDWKWLGWALAGSAFAGSTAAYVAHQLLHLDDVRMAWAMVVVFALVFSGLVVGKVRNDAWWRRFRLTADYEAGSGEADDPPKPRA